MVFEARKQSMAWMEMDYSKHSHSRRKIKWRLKHLGALGIMDEALPSDWLQTFLFSEKNMWSSYFRSINKCSQSTDGRRRVKVIAFFCSAADPENAKVLLEGYF